MTTITATRPYFPVALLFLGLLIFGGIGISMAADMLSAHAVTKHGTVAVEVHQCLLSGGSPIMHLSNPDTGREAFVVCLPDGRHGVQIDEPTGENVTAYKMRYRLLSDVLGYFMGGGWTIGVLLLGSAVGLRAAWWFLCNLG